MRFTRFIRFNSLSAKVLLAYVVAAALSMGLFAVAGYAVVVSRGDILSAAQVAERAEDLAGMLSFDAKGIPVGFDDRNANLRAWLYDSLNREFAYRVLDASGNVVLSSNADEGLWPTTGAATHLKKGRFDFEHKGIAMRGATQPLERDGNAWFLQFAASTRFMHLMYQGFALPFTGAGVTIFSVVFLFVFGACAFVTLKYTLKPLRAVSDAAAAISPRSLNARLRSDTVPSEITPLVDSFNRVLGRLEHGYRTQQEFLSTAAHELKTPLALIRAQIESGDAELDRHALLNDTLHMTRQVQQLLLLAEASEAQNYHFAPVDVKDAATEAASYLQRMADAADVHLVVASTEGFPVARWNADRGALFTLLKNMLENAIQHAPKGSEVKVEVSGSTISVRDWGAGVEEAQLARMFVRFWRGEHRRDHGAGLGLAICREIAVAHGWTLSAYREDPGLRLCVSRSKESW